MIDRFNRRKQDVLSKIDKSHKQEWDNKILDLCKKINSLNNYYTSSSCSGRIMLMIDQSKKGEDLFVFVSHNKISFEELKKAIESSKKGKNIKFKLEPCILHINCRTLNDAEEIYNKAKLAGWKKSGIIGMRNGFSVELNGTDRLEFPVIRGNRILVEDEFLKIIVDESNMKLERNWLKIRKLENSI